MLYGLEIIEKLKKKHPDIKFHICINPKTKKVSYLGETSTIHFKPSKSINKK